MENIIQDRGYGGREVSGEETGSYSGNLGLSKRTKEN